MTDTTARVRGHATILVDYSANVQPGETVAISTTTLATPLVEAIYQRVLERGGHPTALVAPPRLEEIFLRTASEEQLRRPPFFLEVGLDYFDHIITVLAPENTRYANGIDPQRQVQVAAGRAALMPKYMDKLMQPARSITITAHPTPALAQDAAMSLLDYEDFFYHACLLDEADPQTAWQAMAARQARICDWLESRSELHIDGPDVDLRLQIAGRRWINGDGHKNFPCGEIFTSPLEDSVEGHIRFTYPAIYQGHEARDVQLWFERGQVVRAEAATGQEFLQAMLETDEGARRLGEVAIGTNHGVTRFTGAVLFDEKMGGTCHLAVGRGFPHIGGQNASAIHWDMVCDLRHGATISADGQVFYRDGEFTVP
jgi:aminopeptidase